MERGDDRRAPQGSRETNHLGPKNKWIVQMDDVEAAQLANQPWEHGRVADLHEWLQPMNLHAVAHFEGRRAGQRGCKHMHIVPPLSELASIVVADITGAASVWRKRRGNMGDTQSHARPPRQSSRAIQKAGWNTIAANRANGPGASWPNSRMYAALL